MVTDPSELSTNETMISVVLEEADAIEMLSSGVEVEAVTVSLSVSPRERAKALSYCQPTKGCGVKVLLRYFLTRK